MYLARVHAVHVLRAGQARRLGQREQPNEGARKAAGVHRTRFIRARALVLGRPIERGLCTRPIFVWTGYQRR